MRRGVGAGADGLGLQGLGGPALAHLIGQHALDVVLNVHDVYDRQPLARAAYVLEAAAVGVALEPGPRVLARGQDAEAELLPAVKLKEYARVLRARDRDAVFARGVHALAAVGREGRGRLAAAGIGAVERAEFALIPAREAAGIGRGRGHGLLIALIDPGQQDVPAADGAAGSRGRAVHDHRYARLVRRGEGDEIAPGVVIAEVVAAAHLVFEVCIVQRGLAYGALALVVVERDAHFVILELKRAAHLQVLRRRAGLRGLARAEPDEAGARPDIGLVRAQRRSARGRADPGLGEGHPQRAGAGVYVRGGGPGHEGHTYYNEERQSGGGNAGFHMFTF